MAIKQINDAISYIEASENPLSADIGIVRNGNETWLYDVGGDPDAVLSLTGKYNVVLSHFHADHIGNLDRLDIENLYLSKFTLEHTGRGTVAGEDMYIGDLHIFPLPSSHAKGSLGLEVAGEYAFIGDGLYSRANAEYYIYNPQLLKEEIEVLKGLRAQYLLVSHLKGLVRQKDEVVRELEELYSGWDRKSPEILVKRQGGGS